MEGQKLMPDIRFVSQSKNGDTERVMSIDNLVIAGWTGRDRAKMEEHIAELESLGIKRPHTTPVFYRASAARLTTTDKIQTTGGKSSGEAEVLLINEGGRSWVGLASDHTDREVEAYGITVSKQMCDKPCAHILWPLDEVIDHWDQLRLTSAIHENGHRVIYQQGEVAALLGLQDLVGRYEREIGSFRPCTAMLCGTLPALGGVRSSPVFEMSLEDPVHARRIDHSYRVEVLPIVEA
jgi:hypothetical protein